MKIYVITLCAVIVMLVASPAFFREAASQTNKEQQAQPLQSYTEYIDASKAEVVKELGFQPLDPSQEIEKTILEEMKALDKIAGFSTPVWKTYTSRTTAHREAGIAVNLNELQRYAKQANVKQFRQYLRFILAHEKTHQLQFLKYSRASVRSEDEEQRRIYECQADIMGGEYLTEMQGEPNEEDRQAITDTLKVAFEMGTEEYATAVSHPSREARRTAVRLGMSRGGVTTLLKLPPTPVLKSMIDSIIEKLDTSLGDDVMDWSLRLAKKIIHSSREAQVNITLEEQEIDLDQRPDNSYVTFRLVYKNIGRRAVQVDMEVQCALVPRDAPGDTLRWQKWSAKNFRFRLEPGQRYVAGGTLQCGIPPESNSLSPYIEFSKLQPQLIFPPADTALISAEYVK